MRPAIRLSLAAMSTAMATLVLFAAVALGDPTSPRIQFFACSAGGANAKLVPAGQPLFLPSGFSSGVRGLVEAALPKLTETFSVTYSAGGGATFQLAFGPLRHNSDGTWTAPLRVDFPALAAGDSMTIHWTQTVSQPIEDLVPPSSDWDPAANFQPPWDGTGLKYQNHINPGVIDFGTCTVTAVAP